MIGAAMQKPKSHKKDVETTIAERHDTGNIVFILTAIVANPKKDLIHSKGSISKCS